MTLCFFSLLNSIYDNLEKLELTLSFHSVIKAFLKRIRDLGAHWYVSISIISIPYTYSVPESRDGVRDSDHDTL